MKFPVEGHAPSDKAVAAPLTESVLLFRPDALAAHVETKSPSLTAKLAQPAPSAAQEAQPSAMEAPSAGANERPAAESEASLMAKNIGALMASHFVTFESSAITHFFASMGDAGQPGSFSFAITTADQSPKLDLSRFDAKTIISGNSGQEIIDPPSEMQNTLSSGTLPSSGFQSQSEQAFKAVGSFIKNTPDFKITQLGKDIILFDVAHGSEPATNQEVHTWSLQDGSKITIIGTLTDHIMA